MTESQKENATRSNGETTTNLARSSSTYRYESNVINGYVLRAKVFESIKQERSPLLKPIIEVN